jgi:5-(carboxyamino)imidazole ribonucleotide synthase
MARATIRPGAALGVLGSGQLGRMFALAARRLGYGVQVFSPSPDSPAGQVADHEWVAAYDDLEAVRRFARAVRATTFEFENVPAASAAAAAALTVVRPAGQVLHTTQDRLREKSFLASAGLPVAPFAAVRSDVELESALGRLGLPAVLKTAGFGYDGKGQRVLRAASDSRRAWRELGGQPCVLEAFVEFECELSVVAARGHDGEFQAFPVIENQHRGHVLDVSSVPARVAPEVAQAAEELTRQVCEQLEVVGVLCVEFFLAPGGRLLINELAPRPHNSGHLTIEACVTSQFEQQVRALCGLPLGAPELLRPAAMANLMGELWAAGEPDWAGACSWPGVKLHLYGKTEARPGRKMGHLTALAATADEARARVLGARAALVRREPNT